MKITVETLVKAELNAVWAAWSNPEDIKRWNAASDDWHPARRGEGEAQISVARL